VDIAEVGEQSLFGMPGVFRQVLEQGEVDARIEVRVSEHFVDQLPELKPLKSVLGGLDRPSWMRPVRQCLGWDGPLPAVAQ
jgi:hypothetical protein